MYEKSVFDILTEQKIGTLLVGGEDHVQLGRQLVDLQVIEDGVQVGAVLVHGVARGDDERPPRSARLVPSHLHVLFVQVEHSKRYQQLIVASVRAEGHLQLELTNYI